jgi:SAM-dependent methyltransferase
VALRPNGRVNFPSPLMISTSATTSSRRLHLGAGTTVVPGWINLDGSWNARLAAHPKLRKALGALGLLPRQVASVRWQQGLVHHDVRRPLPYKDSSIAAVYSSHMLEHLYRVDAERVLTEVYRVLEPGGVVRLVVPDVRAIVERYIRALGNARAADAKPAADVLNEQLLFRDRAPARGSLPYRLYRSLVDFHSHKWMYDADSLAALMSNAGFTQVRECALFDSAIEEIQIIEQPSRVADGAGICVEGVKPLQASHP